MSDNPDSKSQLAGNTDTHAPGWYLQSMEAGKMMLYTSAVTQNVMQRSDNSMSVVGLPSHGSISDWTICIFPEDLPYVENAFRSLTPDEPNYKIEYRFRHAVTGRRFWVLDSGTAEFDEDENPQCMRGAILNISSGVRDETDIRDSARLHSIAAEAAQMGIWHFDRLSNRLTFSNELLALLEIDRTTFGNNPEAIIRRVHPDDLAIWRQERKKIFAPGGKLEFEFRVIFPQRNIRWFLVRGHMVRRPDGVELESYGVMIDVTERKDSEKHQTMLLRELSHRVSNTLAVIQSIMRQTLRAKNDPKAFAQAFEGRINSLAVSHTLLTSADWQGGTLSDLINIQLRGIVDNLESKIVLHGPEIVLPAETATQIGLVLHELGTNAVKYGALSVDTGKISISWSLLPGKVQLVWCEQGGPPIDEVPSYTGFGTSLISQSVDSMNCSYDHAGLICRMELLL